MQKLSYAIVEHSVEREHRVEISYQQRASTMMETMEDFRAVCAALVTERMAWPPAFYFSLYAKEPCAPRPYYFAPLDIDDEAAIRQMLKGPIAHNDNLVQGR